MAPKENAEAVKLIYRQWGDGDFRASLAVVDPHFLLVMRPGFPESGTYLGLERLAEYMRGFLEAWSRITIEAEGVTVAGDSVVVSARQRGVGIQSGAETDFRYTQVWTFRGATAIRLENFRDRAEALEAVGLSDRLA